MKLLHEISNDPQKQPQVVFYKNKVFLKTSQNSQEENLRQSLFFNKFPGITLQRY